MKSINTVNLTATLVLVGKYFEPEKNQAVYDSSQKVATLRLSKFILTLDYK